MSQVITWTILHVDWLCIYARYASALSACSRTLQIFFSTWASHVLQSVRQFYQMIFINSGGAGLISVNIGLNCPLLILEPQASGSNLIPFHAWILWKTIKLWYFAVIDVGGNIMGWKWVFLRENFSQYRLWCKFLRVSPGFLLYRHTSEQLSGFPLWLQMHKQMLLFDVEMMKICWISSGHCLFQYQKG